MSDELNPAARIAALRIEVSEVYRLGRVPERQLCELYDLQEDHPAEEEDVDWPPERQLAAQREGWDIFECSSTEHPPFELQAIAAPTDHPQLDYTEPKFLTPDGKVSDLGAWRHVIARASEGSDLHQQALTFLRAYSITEYDYIIEQVRRDLHG